MSSIKCPKKQGRKMHFLAPILAQFLLKTTTSCGQTALFFVSTTIRHHYYRLNMPCGYNTDALKKIY
jgi:hypothetical protein